MSYHPSLYIRKNDVFLTIKVHPNSSLIKIEVSEFAIDVYIKEPADKNKANISVIKYLSKSLQLPSTKIQIVKGAKSRTKILLIENLKPEKLMERLRNS